MTETGVDSFANNSVIADDDEPMIVGDGQRVYSRTIVRSKDKVLKPVNNEPIVVEKGVHGTIVMVKRAKHYAFLKRNDNNQYKDIFAREASIVNQSHQRKKFFLSDTSIKGFEAVNIQITERNIKSISQLPKIPRKKKESNEQQMELLKDVFKSTIAELFIEASKKTSKKKK
ncbi:unnamed protein product [Rotaria sordida]|uniref:Uncharacterized protein n=1 Tax=Rotaria sordida TaxID=392033 RepID=A0A816E283_9BILA|nr:unnamed protein product [Rotaria sordida]CAF1644241.1 unnamed protein product [Rotaria sordida]